MNAIDIEWQGVSPMIWKNNVPFWLDCTVARKTSASQLIRGLTTKWGWTKVVLNIFFNRITLLYSLPKIASSQNVSWNINFLKTWKLPEHWVIPIAFGEDFFQLSPFFNPQSYFWFSGLLDSFVPNIARLNEGGIYGHKLGIKSSPG